MSDALLPFPARPARLEVNPLRTVADLILILQTFDPTWAVRINQQERIMSVDGRGDVNELWICDHAHSPMRLLLPKPEDW